MSHKHYFNNFVVTSAVLEYQSTGDSSVLSPYVGQFQKLVLGEINTHHFFAYGSDNDESEDMKQEGFATIMSCVRRYNSNFGKPLFSYLSLAIKYGLIDYTRRVGRRMKNIVSFEESFPYGDNGDIPPILMVFPTVGSTNKNDEYSKIIRIMKTVTGPAKRVAQSIEAVLGTPDCSHAFEEDSVVYLMKSACVSRLQMDKALSVISRLMNAVEDKVVEEGVVEENVDQNKAESIRDPGRSSPDVDERNGGVD
jgi:hypothetical protein